MSSTRRSSGRKRSKSVKVQEDHTGDLSSSSESESDDDVAVSSTPRPATTTPRSTGSMIQILPRRLFPEPILPRRLFPEPITISSVFGVFGQDYNKLKSQRKVPAINNKTTVFNYRWNNLLVFYQDFIKAMLNVFTVPAQRNFISSGLKAYLGQELSHGENNKADTKMISTVHELYKNSPHNSNQKRCFRVVLVKGLSKKQQTELGLSTSGHFERAGYHDYNLLVQGKNIEKIKYTRCRMHKKIIMRLVKFIYSEKICQHISYGVRKIVLAPNETYEFPRLMRLALPNILFELYKSTFPKSKRVGETLFRKTLTTLTSHDPKILQAIDYVSNNLVNDNVDLLHEIIERMVKPGKEKNHLLKLLYAAKHFISKQYQSHAVIRNDQCCFHGLDFALDSRYNSPERNATTPACMFPFFVTDQIADEVLKNSYEKSDDVVNEAKTAIYNCREKFLRHMQHSCRVSCQKKEIERILNEMEKECVRTGGKVIHAHLVMDFKMKFLPQKYREAMIDFFGKKGMVWHGFLLIYYEMVDTVNEKGEKVKVPRRVNVYIDQIMKEGTKQDVLTVVGLLEAVMASIHVHFPNIKEISLQADNAGCYTSKFLLFGILFLNKKFEENGLMITELLHTETQAGKSILDGHFSQAGNHLRNWLNNIMDGRGKKILTGTDLAWALSSGPGMNNCIVQHIHLRRDVLEKMFKIAAPMMKKVGEYFSRVNHIYFPEIISISQEKIKQRRSKNRNNENLENCETNENLRIFERMEGRFMVQAHSNIGRKIPFDFNMVNKSVFSDIIGENIAFLWLDDHARKHYLEEEEEYVPPTSPVPMMNLTKTQMVLLQKKPTEYINIKIKKDFGGTDYPGVISSHDGITGYWKIEYDDGDNEDFDACDMAKALISYDDRERANNNNNNDDDNNTNNNNNKHLARPQDYIGNQSTGPNKRRQYTNNKNNKMNCNDADDTSTDSSSSSDDMDDTSTNDSSSSDDMDDTSIDSSRSSDDSKSSSGQFILEDDDSGRGADDSDDDSFFEDVLISTENVYSKCYYGPPQEQIYKDLSTGIDILDIKPLGKISITRRKTETDTIATVNTVGNSREKRRDALAVAVRMANQILQSDNNFHTAEEDLPIYSLARNYSFGSLKPGWARRKKGENPNGESYMTKKYKKIIRKEYGGGMGPGGDKKSASDMREIMRKGNKDLFLLPGETCIKQYIGSLRAAEKKGTLTVQNVFLDDSDEDDEASGSDSEDEVDEADNEISDHGNNQRREARVRKGRDPDPAVSKDDMKLVMRVVNQGPQETVADLYDRWFELATAENSDVEATMTSKKTNLIKSRIRTRIAKLKRMAARTIVHGD